MIEDSEERYGFSPIERMFPSIWHQIEMERHIAEAFAVPPVMLAYLEHNPKRMHYERIVMLGLVRFDRNGCIRVEDQELAERALRWDYEDESRSRAAGLKYSVVCYHS